jgi:signal transduction histidine kinase
MTERRVDSILGGKWSISGIVMFYAFPILLFAVPVNENGFASWWIFWRWTMVSFLTLIPFFILYFVVGITIFKDREKNPLPSYYLFILGFFLGFTRGATLSWIADGLNMVNLDGRTFSEYFWINSLHYGVLTMLSLPFWALIAAAIELYSEDRKALISDLMFNQSQRAESAAVIKSLRSSMTRKVDENLLEVIEDAHIYLDNKGKALEQNWELMAVRLRKAALDTIRPFSHQLHRAGEEKQYKAKLPELLRFVTGNFRVDVSWVLLAYLVIYLPSILLNSPFTFGLANVAFRCILIFVGIKFLLLLKRVGALKYFLAFFIALSLLAVGFGFIVSATDQIFQLNRDSYYSLFAESISLIFLTLTMGLINTFVYGQHAEAEFLEQQLSKEKLEAMLLKREEERLSRELAKYLHGTIQSRLMASAMAIEKAGRKGDKAALKKELAQAYASLRVPSAQYFAAPADSFQEEVTQAVNKWNNLLNIKTVIDKKIKDVDSTKAQEIGNAINEGLSNAFRHGGATNVKINVKQNSYGLKIEIIDDGDGPTGGKGGLGSEWFNAIAGSSWSLKKNPRAKGSILELNIPN